MQSGISVSQELLSTFKNLVKSPDQRGIICTIDDETIISSQILSPATQSFSDDLSLVIPHIKPNIASYIILRRYDDPSSKSPYIAITFIPDTAPVRSKMLYASTRTTLVRELGHEHFRETIFTTSMDELTPLGLEKHDEHTRSNAPLTQEEETLQKIKLSEAQEKSHAMRAGISNFSSGLNIPTSDNVSICLSKLAKSFDHQKAEDFNLIQLKFIIESETLEVDSQTSTPVSQLATLISNTSPRYSFYRYTHVNNGITCSPIFFIYTCPTTSKVKERMLYAASSRPVQHLAEQIGLNIDKKIEGYPTEITEENLRAELYPKVEVTQKFDRPRRPPSNRKPHSGAV